MNALHGLHEALLTLQEEELEYARRDTGETVRRARRASRRWGCGSRSRRIAPISTIVLPDGVDEAAVRRRLLLELYLEADAYLVSLPDGRGVLSSWATRDGPRT